MTDTVEPKTPEERRQLIAETNLLLGNQKAERGEFPESLNLRAKQYCGMGNGLIGSVEDVCKQIAQDFQLMVNSTTDNYIDFITKNGKVYRANIALPKAAIRMSEIPIPVFTEV